MKKIMSAIIIIVLGAVMLGFTDTDDSRRKKTEAAAEPVTEKAGGLYAGTSEHISQKIPIEAISVPEETAVEQEQGVYTFLQGPRAWQEAFDWAGEWCQFNINGNPFGGFGCGLCCIANIYSTLSPYECSPLDAYEYAKNVSQYSPTGKTGAIGWEDLQRTLAACGMTSDIYGKPPTYEAFQEQMSRSESAIVLVCSKDDDTYWKDTPGHYVNIWLYQEDTDMVFLAEPGDPENNRSWVPLRYIYDALKTSSSFQYLAVDSYTEEYNQWKWNTIDIEWNKP